MEVLHATDAQAENLPGRAQGHAKAPSIHLSPTQVFSDAAFPTVGNKKAQKTAVRELLLRPPLLLLRKA